ncbi:hypothetical protein N658DRAFT_243350 [Parathielavia hyrcaniae]|uniref:Uncharacterized protein n=1 Tax=Parathielavia hyrcaniae TaxID=113614 RepID=A0AAN6Q5T8_9PEZI|nr:hypothetical protein N658DRAFT_243350 [Parathielavia hyrcaniae]
MPPFCVPPFYLPTPYLFQRLSLYPSMPEVMPPFCIPPLVCPFLNARSHFLMLYLYTNPIHQIHTALSPNSISFPPRVPTDLYLKPCSCGSDSDLKMC